MPSRGGKENEKQKKKNRFSSEFTMLSILEYLYTNTQKMSVSKYNIVINTPGIKQQRPDRVNVMIDSLKKNGYITSVNTSSNLTFYRITQNGGHHGHHHGGHHHGSHHHHGGHHHGGMGGGGGRFSCG